MLIHPDIHREIARQRHQDLVAAARRRRVATGRRRSAAAAAADRNVTRRSVSEGVLECDGVLTAADHFGHRETDGIVVDLFWTRRNLKDEFRVEVEDEREGTRFVLHPRTGREAIQAFYHPLSAQARSRRGVMRTRSGD